MKNDKIKNHIHELYLQSGMQSKEFEERVCDAINSDVNATVQIPDHSTMNRWHNGQTVPDANMIPYIAKALGVSDEEIRLGEKPKTDFLQEKVNELNEVLNMNEKEKETLSKLLFMSEYYLRFFAVFLFSLGLIFLNSTLWQNGALYLFALIVIAATTIYDRKKYSNYYLEQKNKSIKEKAKENWEFLNSLLKKNLISRLCLDMLILISVVIFLPALETHFYRGKFYITCVVYFFTGALLLHRSIKKS